MDVYLEKSGDRIWMACPPIPQHKDKLKDLGAGWVKGPKPRDWAQKVSGSVRTPPGIYTFPLSYRVCMDLRALFKRDNIRIQPALWEWAKGQQQRRKDLAWIKEQQDMPLPVLEEEYPDVAKAVHHRSFQAVGIAWLVRARRALLGDDPGLGKTIQSTSAVIEDRTKGPCVIFAPSSAVSITWPNEFDQWFPNETYYVADGSREWRQEVLEQFWEDVKTLPNERTWLFCNIEMVQPDRELSEKWVARTQALYESQYETVMERVAHWRVDLESGEVTDEIIDLCENFNIQVDETFTKTVMVKLVEAEFDGWKLKREWHTKEEPRFPLLFEHDWAAVIMDEGHRFLPTNTSVAHKQSQTRAAIQALPFADDALMFDLTGTPMRGKPLNMWGHFYYLDRVQYSGYWNYVNRFWHVIPTEYGKDLLLDDEAVQDYTADLDSMMLRRTKAEVAPWLPPKAYGGTRLVPGDETSPRGVWIDLTPKQKAAYDMMVNEALFRFEKGEIFAMGALAEITRLKQISTAYGNVRQILKRVPGEDFMAWVNAFVPDFPSNKWDWLADEFLQTRGIWKPKEAFGEDKVIVASWQSNVLRMFHKRCMDYKIPSLILTGSESPAKRREAATAFQAEGGPRLIFLNTVAGGVSLTLDRADNTAVLDETWNPDDATQLEDRSHRISRPDHRAAYWYVRSRGTIEEQIAAMNDTSDNIQRLIMDGRRGVKYVKQLIGG